MADLEQARNRYRAKEAEKKGKKGNLISRHVLADAHGISIIAKE